MEMPTSRYWVVGRNVFLITNKDHKERNVSHEPVAPFLLCNPTRTGIWGNLRSAQAHLQYFIFMQPILKKQQSKKHCKRDSKTFPDKLFREIFSSYSKVKEQVINIESQNKWDLGIIFSKNRIRKTYGP